jgi:biopolymer transport protein ExbB
MLDERVSIARRWFACLLALAALGGVSPRACWSQAAAADAAAVAGAGAAAAGTSGTLAEKVSSKNLFELIKDGGPMMYPLFACSFITLVFVFERAISLRRGRVIPRPFVKRFLHQVREGKLDREGALELCEENGSPVATVFAAAARKWGRPSVELEQSIIDAGDRASGPLRRYVRLFNAVATISPLMGLLGTVFGMMRVFETVSSADAMGRTELLAGGISEALITTASGLVIAIPALCFYVVFASKVERLVMEIDDHAQELVGLISAEALHDERQSKLRAKSRPPAAA